MASKIKIFNYQLNQTTVEEINKLSEKDMNPEYAFILYKIIMELESITKSKDKVLTKIYEKYGEKFEENGEQKLSIPAANVEKFKNEMEKLENISNELSFNKMNYKDLEIEGKIAVKTLGILSFMFTDFDNDTKSDKKEKEKEAEVIS